MLVIMSNMRHTDGFFISVESKSILTLLKVVIELKADVRQIKTQLGELKEVMMDIRASSLVDAREEDDESNLKLPLNDFGGTESFEEKLMDDRALKRQLVKTNIQLYKALILWL